MSESIHGHEVMQMMIASGGTFTKESLRERIVVKFGEDARFHTCSAENMTAEEIIDFLAGKQKFIESENGFTTDESHICTH